MTAAPTEVFCFGEGAAFPKDQFSPDLAVHEKELPAGTPRHYRVTGVPIAGEIQVQPVPAALPNEDIENYRNSIELMVKDDSGSVDPGRIGG